MRYYPKIKAQFFLIFALSSVGELDAAKEEIAAEFAKLVTDGLPDSECLLGTFQP